MSRVPGRIWAFVAIATAVVLGAGTYAVVAFQGRQQPSLASPTDGADIAAVQAVPHLVFRSTAPDSSFGTVTLVPLDDPSGPRAHTAIECDRIASIEGSTACLRTIAGVATKYEASLYDGSWNEVDIWPLPGIPSRTRFSDDGTMLATTAFVTGHSYATTGFTTQTLIHNLGNGDSVDLESLTLIVDGRAVAPVDRNLWGVTFVDDTTFYATAQSQSLGHTWLVRGDLSAGTVTVVQDGGACPSLSPDGTRLAFKTQTSTDPVHWTPSILDLASGKVTVLDSETRSYDDQIVWLDDDTILYGIPRQNEPGVTDVWSLEVNGGAKPQLYLEEAWSPQVVG